MWCEQNNEIEQFTDERQNQLELIEKYAYELHKLDGMPARQKHDSVIKVLKNYTTNFGVNVDDVLVPQWTFLNAAFYALTVYTTIGYGNIYPLTSAGRIITIIYAFFGIPLALVTVIVIGGLFARICKILWKIVIHSLAKSSSIVSKDIEKQLKKLDVTDDAKKKNEDSEDLLSFPISFLVTITLLWIFVCAILFKHIEPDWNFGVSLYFTLISFTTIGFGDVSFSDYDYMILVGLCVLIGLSLVSTILNVIQQQIEALGTKLDFEIDKNYNETLKSAYEGEDYPVVVEDAEECNLIETTPEPSKITGLEMLKEKLKVDSMVSKMPLKNRLLYNVLPAVTKENIKSKAEKKMNLRIVGTQTDYIYVPVGIQTDYEVSQTEAQTDANELTQSGTQIEKIFLQPRKSISSTHRRLSR